MLPTGSAHGGAMAHKRVTSNVGLSVIKDHEGLSLVAYKDPSLVWTIGYGHTESVTPGQFITTEQAHTLLLADVQRAEDCVNKHVLVPLYQSQFDALVSFAFNQSCDWFRSTSLLGYLNNGNYLGAADEFIRWIYLDGRELSGLVRRRALEQSLFLSNLSLLHNFPVENYRRVGFER